MIFSRAADFAARSSDSSVCRVLFERKFDCRKINVRLRRFVKIVRENIIERAGILSRCFLVKLDLNQILDAMLLSEQRKQMLSGGDGGKTKSAAKILTYEDMKNLERENLNAALRAANYRIYGAGGAAELLGTKPTTLVSRIKSLKIQMRPN